MCTVLLLPGVNTTAVNRYIDINMYSICHNYHFILLFQELATSFGLTRSSPGQILVHIIQGVSKRTLQLWKRIEIHSATCMKGIFSYGDSLKIECSYHLCLQMSLNSELELLPQLQKWRQRCYVACGKRLTTGGTSAALPMEVSLNHNYPR